MHASLHRPQRAPERPSFRPLGGAVVAILLLAFPAGASEPQWVDGSGETALDFVHFNGMTGELYFSEIMGSGVALLDYDGDGDLDSYWVQGAMLEPGDDQATALIPRRGVAGDRLLRNDRLDDGGLRWTDVTAASGLAAEGNGMGVAVGDVDGDGVPDLYVTNLGANQLWRNRGDGSFEDRTRPAAVGDRRWGVSASFSDYDGDGRLDLYVGNYVGFRRAVHKECLSPTGIADYCGPLSYEAEPDVLYRNVGDGTFEDVTQRSGLAAAGDGSTLGVIAADFDGDGSTDFYTANDQVPNRLWLQLEPGSFLDDAMVTGTAVNEEGQPEASMGLVAADFDHDGSIDLFLSHLTRETNTLYLNDGNGVFRDSTRDSGLGLSSWQATGFGVGVLDADLDGLLDLFITNGAVRRLPELVAAGDAFPLRQPDLFYRNVGAGSFEDVSEASGVLALPTEVGRGVAVGDIDNDGDPDLAVSNNSGPGLFLRNETTVGNSWVGCRLLDRTGATTLGSTVEARRSGFVARTTSRTDGSYASANDARTLLGLGSDEGPHELEIGFPSGRRLRVRKAPTARWLTFDGASPGVFADGAVEAAQ